MAKPDVNKAGKKGVHNGDNNTDCLGRRECIFGDNNTDTYLPF